MSDIYSHLQEQLKRAKENVGNVKRAEKDGRLFDAIGQAVVLREEVDEMQRVIYGLNDRLLREKMGERSNQLTEKLST